MLCPLLPLSQNSGSAHASDHFTAKTCSHLQHRFSIIWTSFGSVVAVVVVPSCLLGLNTLLPCLVAAGWKALLKKSCCMGEILTSLTCSVLDVLKGWWITWMSSSQSVIIMSTCCASVHLWGNSGCKWNDSYTVRYPADIAAHVELTESCSLHMCYLHICAQWSVDGSWHVCNGWFKASVGISSCLVLLFLWQCETF